MSESPTPARKILVVDDDWLNRDLLEAYLRDAGYECITASDGAAALQIAQAAPPDLVLCDVQMPRMSGYEVCHRLKTNPATQFVPVVMVTALDSDDEKLRAVEAGADDFVTKPFNSILLLTRVRSLLRIKVLHDEVEERNALLRQVLTRYLAEGVVETILTNPDRYLRLGGETRSVTVLFADIRGFTAFTEHRSGQQVVEALNSIFPELTRVVFSHRGTFDKFLGDAIMAFWGAPLAGADDTFRAVKAAVEMRDTFNLLCARSSGGMANLGLGIGLNTGDATVGNIGSDKVMDYTVIGDTVNVARRLQENALASEILVSEATYRIVQSQVRADRQEARSLHNRQDPVMVYSVREVVD
ncbi:MAG: response regulator [Chloroflexi bacterium]|nr:response regulator [Chloroflexota bacterium]